MNNSSSKRLKISLTQQSIINLFLELTEHLIYRIQPLRLIQYYKNFFIKQYRMGKISKQLPQEQKIEIEILSLVLNKIDTYHSENIINSNNQMKFKQKFKCELTDLIEENVRQAKQVIQILNNIISQILDYFNSQNRGKSYILSY